MNIKTLYLPPQGRFTKKAILQNLAFLLLITFMLLIPAIYSKIAVNDTLTTIIKHFIICFLFLLIPIVIFYRNIKIYLYLLVVFALLVPLTCSSIYFFRVNDMSVIITLILQTNIHEALELAKGFELPFIIITLIYVFIYLLLVKKISVRKLPFLWALFISLFSAIVVGRKLYQKSKSSSQEPALILNRYFPVSVISSISYTVRNNSFDYKEINKFSFHAFKKDTVTDRQVYIFIIGESSDYYHWAINGYQRPTSPRLSSLKGLISFSDVAAGAHLTMLAVPQMITRARPGNMEAIYKEKGIMSAFNDAGFKTIWLNNQYPDYWASTIVPHAKTADWYLFPDAKRLDPSDPYDGRFFPIIDSVIGHSSQNLFIIFHTIGSHWDYSQRYPESFDVFKPSGKDISVNQFTKNNRQPMINSYDNSILYSDFIIDSVINMVKKYDLISFVTFLSDHGEDVFDTNQKVWYSHDNASKFTMHIPLFVWTSEKYDKAYTLKRKELESNRNRKIGENDIFYTLLDMANITYPGFDSSRSIVSDSFKDSKQEYIEPEDNVVKYYSDLR